MGNSKYLIIVSILGYGFWSFFLKLASKYLHPFQVSVVNCCVGIALLPIYFYILNTKISSQPFNTIGVIYAGLATLSATMAGLAFIYCIRNSINVSSLYAIATASPIVIALVLGMLFLGEKMSVIKAIGMILIVSGVSLLGR